MLRSEFLNYIDFCHRHSIAPNFTLESLAALELVHPKSADDYRRATAGFDKSRYDGSYLADWVISLGLGSYFGEVLIRNLAGRWKYPSRFLVLYCIYSGYASPIFHHWYVVVGGQKVPVLELAKRRLMMGPKESLVEAYNAIAAGEFKFNREKSQ
jgi:hypothetical protein